MNWSENQQPLSDNTIGEGIQYLLLLLPAAAPSVRLVQQPCAKDWVHVDSYALDAHQQDCT